MLQILCEVLDAAQPEELLPNQIYDRTDQMDQKGCAQNLHQYQRGDTVPGRKESRG